MRASGPTTNKPSVILFGDTFNRSFETKNLYAARKVLEAMGYEVIEPNQTIGLFAVVAHSLRQA